MTVLFETFSKRMRRAQRAGQPEVYTYDSVPAQLRAQICHILRDALGSVPTDSISRHYGNPQSIRRWKYIFDIVCRELGAFSIGDGHSEVDVRCQKYLMDEKDYLKAIDFIEVAFKVVNTVGLPSEADDSGGHHRREMEVEVTKEAAIDELNGRLREHGIGYFFEGNQIIRVDNTFIHSEITKQALALLSEPIFAQANEDFFLAHDHYRHGNYKDCIVAALRSFESTMKAICSKKKWEIKSGYRASDLIKVLRAHKLFPDYLDNGFDSYIAMLKTGLPEIRNHAGGHGATPESAAVPSYVASYALHMTAVNIVFLAQALKG